MPTQKEKCETFKALHEAPGAFVIPNPWDEGSARIMQHLGAPALATTSQGFAQTLGKLDGKVTLEEKLAHCTRLANATDVPINVDFEDGFGIAPERVADHMRAVIGTGVAGCSIEDWDRERQTMIEHSVAVERIAAAAEVVADFDMPFLLTARSELILRQAGDLDAAIKRLQAYERAGAQVLYAPGIASVEDLRSLATAVTRPINLLGVFMPSVTVAEMAQAGAKRISVGSALFNRAMAPVLAACREMLDAGTFAWTSGMTGELQDLISGP
ncbi:MAG: isocitrate lyase/phosphoenolpyruvate mutase family protein [Pseudomonadota bacterium]